MDPAKFEDVDRDVQMMYELRQLPLCPPLTYHHSNYTIIRE